MRQTQCTSEIIFELITQNTVPYGKFISLVIIFKLITHNIWKIYKSQNTW